MARNYQRVATINAPTALGTGNAFGANVAISGNGSTIVIGTSPELQNDVSIAYGILTIGLVDAQSNLVPLVQSSNMTAGNQGQLPVSVAISSDGRTIAVGDPNSNNAAGFAYIFLIDQNNFSPVFSRTLIPILFDAMSFQTGQAIALSGDGQVAIVSSPNGNNGTNIRLLHNAPGTGWNAAPYTDLQLFGVNAYKSLISTNYDSNNGVFAISPLGNFTTNVGMVLYKLEGLFSQQGGVANNNHISGSFPLISTIVTALALSADGKTAILTTNMLPDDFFLYFYSIDHDYDTGATSASTSDSFPLNTAISSVCLNSDGTVGLLASGQTVSVVENKNTPFSQFNDTFVKIKSVSVSYDGAIAVIGDQGLTATDTDGIVYVYADNFTISDYVVSTVAIPGGQILVQFTPTFSSYGPERSATASVTIGETLISDFPVSYRQQFSRDLVVPCSIAGSTTVTVTLTDSITNFTISDNAPLTIHPLLFSNISDQIICVHTNDLFVSFDLTISDFGPDEIMPNPVYVEATLNGQVLNPPGIGLITLPAQQIGTVFHFSLSNLPPSDYTLLLQASASPSGATVLSSNPACVTSSIAATITMVDVSLTVNGIDSDVSSGDSFSLSITPTITSPVSTHGNLTLQIENIFTSDVLVSYGSSQQLKFGPIPCVNSISPNSITLTLSDTVTGCQSMLSAPPIIINPFSCKAGSPDQTINANTPTTLTATPSVKDESLAAQISYVWSISDGSVIGTEASVSVSPSSDTEYIVKATTSNNCTVSDTVTITVKQCQITLSDLQVTPQNIVAGTNYWLSFTPKIFNSSSLTGSARVNGSDSPVTYGTPAMLGPFIAGCSDFSVTITVMDSTNQNCQATSDITIPIIPLTVSAGSSQTISAGMTGTLGSGQPITDVTYHWTSNPNDPTIADINSLNTTATPSVSTSYTLRATPLNTACATSDTVTITLQACSMALPIISVTSDVLAGSTITVQCTPTITNGGNTAVVTASIGGNTSSDVVVPSGFDANLSILAPCVSGTLVITAHDSDNISCAKSDTIAITVQPLTVNIIPQTSDIIEGQSVTISVSDAILSSASYVWNTGASGFSIIVSDASDYTVTVRNGNCFASDTVTITLQACSMALPIISVTSDVLAGSTITVQCTPTITNGGNTAVVTASIGGNTSSDVVVPSGFDANLSILAPCVSGTLVITAHDSDNISCAKSDTIAITVQPLTVNIIPQTSDIIEGQFVTIRVSDPLSGVIYNWSTGATGNNITVSDTADYTVIARSGPVCTASDTSSITVNVPQVCVTLSDVQVSFLGRFRELEITGTQFSTIAGLRFISSNYHGVETVFSDIQNGNFKLQNAGAFQSGNANLIRLTAFVSDNPTCAQNISDLHVSPSGLFIGYIGSLLNLVLYLPPELTETIHTSDISLIFSDICAFASQKHCHRFVAGFEVLEHSDVFPQNATVLNGHHMAYIFCSDSSLHVEEIFGSFTFITDMFTSDAVTVRHHEPSFDITKPMQRTEYKFDVFDDKIVWATPCDSNVPFVNMNNIVDLPLLAVDTETAPVMQIDSVTCIPVCDTTTSDAQYVCHLCKCAQKMDGYLTQHYPNYPDLHPDHCRITYTGNIIANILSIDLDHCMICFSDFLIPDCSDSICF
ncbi:MAG: hypothetical protein AAB323_00175 [Pseudomonadota bacterium]